MGTVWNKAKKVNLLRSNIPISFELNNLLLFYTHGKKTRYVFM